MNEIRFIRKNGRVIPIKVKPRNEIDFKAAAIKGGVAVASAGIGISKSSKFIKKSFKHFNVSANLRASSKLVGTAETRKINSILYEKIIKASARSKIKGRSFVQKGRIAALVGIGVGSYMAASSIGEFVKDNEYKNEIKGFAGAAFSTGAAAILGRKVGMRGIRSLSSIFNQYAKSGRAMTREKIRNVSKTAYKGFKKKWHVPETQLDLPFPKQANNFDIKKFLKGF